MEPSFINGAFRPTDLAVAASVANMLGLSSLSIRLHDQKLLELPVRSAGLARPVFLLLFLVFLDRSFFGGSFVDGSVFA